MSKRLKLSGKMIAVPFQAAPVVTVYITFSPYGERAVYYVGTDKEAALDAKQCVDDRCYQQTLTVLAKGELREDFCFELGSVGAPKIKPHKVEEVLTFRDGKPVIVDRITFPNG